MHLQIRNDKINQLLALSSSRLSLFILILTNSFFEINLVFKNCRVLFFFFIFAKKCLWSFPILAEKTHARGGGAGHRNLARGGFGPLCFFVAFRKRFCPGLANYEKKNLRVERRCDTTAPTLGMAS
jgi:hypothetical protein